MGQKVNMGQKVTKEIWVKLDDLDIMAHPVLKDDKEKRG